IEHPQKEHDVPAPLRARELVDLSLSKPNRPREPVALRRPPRLIEVVRVDVDRRHLGSPLGELEAVKPRVAPDVEHRSPGEILRQVRGELLPLEVRKVPERMPWMRLRAIRKVQIVEPRSQAFDFSLEGAHASTFRDGRDIARLSLAVVLEGRRTPGRASRGRRERLEIPLEQPRAMASRVLGENALASALRDPAALGVARREQVSSDVLSAAREQELASR